MDEWKLPWEGGCRCGALRFRISAPPMLTAACHCTGCQKMTGGPYSLSVTVPAEGFTLLSGDPVLGGLRGPQVHHHHCSACMSWVYTRVEGLDFFVNVRATMLDTPGWYRPWLECWTSEALPWAVIGAPRMHETMPTEMTEFQALIAEFAAEGARP
jgi:hypothetical protein